MPVDSEKNGIQNSALANTISDVEWLCKCVIPTGCDVDVI